ncbi:DUF6731 family protein [Pseudomonas aeruginosa]|uniref:DUF6731 family protein n=1 Tax=Pseudomonas aeruginosa TaxID=287 RepID=UPI001ADF24AA|nr:hypothetical protein [Pseudomonas aeruginosa]
MAIPATSTTKYLIRFYEAKLYQNGKAIRLSKLFGALINRGGQLAIRALIENKSDYQVRGLTSHDGGKEYRGFFVRFRSDVPLTGSRKSLDEKPVELADGHEILEKNHFSLFVGANYEVLVFQQSLEGGSISGLARYLSAIAGDTFVVQFNDILTTESLDQLLSGNTIKHVDFRIARPRNKKYAPDPDDTWTQKGLDFMNETGATSFQAKLSIKSPTRGLFADIKNPIQKLLSSSQTRKLKVKLSDLADPIDLFADRIKDKIDVTLYKGLPKSEEVYKSMWASKMRLEKRLVEYFGKRDEALD